MRVPAETVPMAWVEEPQWLVEPESSPAAPGPSQEEPLGGGTGVTETRLPMEHPGWRGREPVTGNREGL